MTFSRVASDTNSGLRRVRETVAVDTPACLAMSLLSQRSRCRLLPYYLFSPSVAASSGNDIILETVKDYFDTLIPHHTLIFSIIFFVNEQSDITYLQHLLLKKMSV